jgi:hypothetical protein
VNDFVTIKTFDNFVTANFDKQKLEENEISCYLADEYIITIQWVLSNAAGGIKLRVLQGDAERALQILDEKADELQVEFKIENSDVICPECGSNNTTTEKFLRPIAGLSWLILGFPLRLNPGRTSQCFYCGNQWRR